MKLRVQQIAVNRWPYGLTVRSSQAGLVLEPQRKARAGWAKRFKQPALMDETAELRSVSNQFDRKEWKW